MMFYKKLLYFHEKPLFVLKKHDILESAWLFLLYNGVSNQSSQYEINKRRVYVFSIRSCWGY